MKKKMTISEKILAKASHRKSVSPGEIIWVDVDCLLTHDVCGPGTISLFKKHFGHEAKVFDREKVVFIPDHYIFTKDQKAKRNREYLRDFAEEQKLPYYYDVYSNNYKGVCHIALAEEGFTVPGNVIFGTDSHTCTAGAFGLFSTGVGNSDAAFIMGTGKLWVKVPETKKFIFEGEVPKHVMAKDIILNIIGDIGFEGGTYNTLEIEGEAIERLNMEERMTLCNMAIECGGKNAIIAPDDTTFNYLKGKSKYQETLFFSDADYSYSFKKTYDACGMKAMVAKPPKPDNVVPACELSHQTLTRAYIGSCTGGKITDFLAAAKILKGQKVKVDTFIVPATTRVEKDLKTIKIEEKTLMDIFIESGCKIGLPSCAACLGGPEDTFGRSNRYEKVISTTNRNFPGRMGNSETEIFLASPYTVAASALTGKITDPQEFVS